MANGKNANVLLALPKVWTTFPFLVQWISHETTKRKKHKKIKHNTHLFSHNVHIKCWVNYLFILKVFKIVGLMLKIINCCLLMGMLANVYPPPFPLSWSHPRGRSHQELFLGNIKPIIETCTFVWVYDISKTSIHEGMVIIWNFSWAMHENIPLVWNHASLQIPC